jgi:tripartite-type tricarboxylate transporter receptor subunit TctC
VAPTGTPADIIQKTAREAARGLAAPDVKERLASLGADPVGSTPEEFGAWIKAEHERWGRVVKGAGLYHSQ